MTPSKEKSHEGMCMMWIERLLKAEKEDEEKEESAKDEVKCIIGTSANNQDVKEKGVIH